MTRVFWFCTRPYPALPYTGLWCPNDRNPSLRSLYLIRSGQIYRAESLPPDLPNHCEGEMATSGWGVPAVYRQVSESGYSGLTKGCVDQGICTPEIWSFRTFRFVYPSGSNRLHINHNDNTTLLRWHRVSRSELEMELCWGQ